MGIIKTALEIALEKTEKVKGDRSSIDQFELKQRGKKLANAFLNGDAEIQGELTSKEYEKLPLDSKLSLKKGIFDVLVTQIILPVVKEDQNRLEKTGTGISLVIDNTTNRNEFLNIYKQFLQMITQYFQEAAQYEQAIRQQYAPKLRQKEEEVSRRLGREVRIDPLQDPEFVTFYNQHMTALKSNYEGVIEQVKEEARRLFQN